MTVVEQHVPPRLGDGARAEFAALDKLLAGRPRRNAVVLEVGGFWSAAIRAIAASMSLVSRAPTPTRYFDSVEDAAVWIANEAEPGQSGREGTLIAAVEALRSRPK
jgi:hypothetical protein